MSRRQRVLERYKSDPALQRKIAALLALRDDDPWAALVESTLDAALAAEKSAAQMGIAYKEQTMATERYASPDGLMQTKEQAIGDALGAALEQVCDAAWSLYERQHDRAAIELVSQLLTTTKAALGKPARPADPFAQFLGASIPPGDDVEPFDLVSFFEGRTLGGGKR